MTAEVTFQREWTVRSKWPILSALGTDAVLGNYFDANICVYLFKYGHQPEILDGNQ